MDIDGVAVLGVCVVTAVDGAAEVVGAAVTVVVITRRQNI